MATSEDIILHPANDPETNLYPVTRLTNLLDTSGYRITGLKTINNETVIGTGNITTEVTANKVTNITSSSTDTQYPSAKCVYDKINALVIPQIHIINCTTTAVTNNDFVAGASRQFYKPDGTQITSYADFQTYIGSTTGTLYNSSLNSIDDVLPTALAPIGSGYYLLEELHDNTFINKYIVYVAESSGLSNYKFTDFNNKDLIVLLNGNSLSPNRWILQTFFLTQFYKL